MNKVHKTVWSQTLGQWVVASENAKSQGKSAICKTVVAGIAVMAVYASISMANAAPVSITTNQPGQIVVDSSDEIVTTGTTEYGINIRQTSTGAADGMDITFRGPKIETSGANATAVYLRSVAASGDMTFKNSGALITHGSNAAGIYAENANGVISIHNTGSITTTGDLSPGMRVVSMGASAIQITNTGAITIAGNDSMGILAVGGSNSSGDIVINNSADITVQGQRTVSTGGWANGTLPTAILAYSNRRIGDIKLTSTGNILTQSNNRGIGIFASQSGTGHVELTISGNIETGTTVDNTSLSKSCSNFDDSCDNHGIQSANQAGTDAYSGGNNYVEYSNGTITTHSRTSVGIYQQLIGFSVGSAELVNRGNIVTYGANSDGIRVVVEAAASNTGSTNISNDGHIQTLGADASGVLSTSRDGEMVLALQGNSVIQGGGHLYGSGVTMRSLEHVSDPAQEQAAIQVLTNYGSIESLNDQAIVAHRSRVNAGPGSTEVNNYGTIKGFVNLSTDYDALDTDGVTILSATNSIDGNATLNNYGVWQIQDRSGLSNGTVGEVSNTFGLAGANGTLNNAGTVSIDAAISKAEFNYVDVNNSGSIRVASKTGATSFAPTDIVINGSYQGTSGIVGLNTHLAENLVTSSDRLVVQGDASGTSLLSISPYSAAAGLTTGDGIQVVEVSGTSGASFALASPVVSGAYEYILTTGAGANANNWYLKNYLVNDGGTGTGVGPGIILTNPAGGAALGNQNAALNMFGSSTGFGTGGIFGAGHLGTGNRSSDTSLQQGRPDQWLWATIDHSDMQSHLLDDTQDLDIKNTVAQIGADLYRSSEIRLGVYGGYGQSRIDVQSRYTGTKADGKVDGYQIGVYSSWTPQEVPGLYIDSWGYYGWYDNKISGQFLLSDTKYDSHGLTIAAEAGYGIPLAQTEGRSWILEPNVRVSYSKLSTDSFTDSSGTYYHDADVSGIQTRVGVRLVGEYNTANQNTIQPFAEVNWLHNNIDNSIRLTGTQLESDIGRNVGEVRVGVQGYLGENFKVWGNVAGQRGSEDYRGYQLQVGLGWQW